MTRKALRWRWNQRKSQVYLRERNISHKPPRKEVTQEDEKNE